MGERSIKYVLYCIVLYRLKSTLRNQVPLILEATETAYKPLLSFYLGRRLVRALWLCVGGGGGGARPSNCSIAFTRDKG